MLQVFSELTALLTAMAVSLSLLSFISPIPHFNKKQWQVKP